MLASLGLAGIAQRNTFFPVTGRSSATTDLTVAKLLQTVSAFTESIVAFAVSFEA